MQRSCEQKLAITVVLTYNRRIKTVSIKLLTLEMIIQNEHKLHILHLLYAPRKTHYMNSIHHYFKNIYQYVYFFC